MHYLITCLTGMQTNARKKSGATEESRPVRDGIGVVACFSPNVRCNTRIIFDLIHKMGMNPSANLVKCGKQSADGEPDLAQLILLTLKDHDSRFGDLLANPDCSVIEQIVVDYDLIEVIEQ